MSLAGKSCVVTGGAAGIGAAIARRLTGAGAAVAVWDLDQHAARALAGSAHRCDITDRSEIEAAFAATLDRHAQVDVLVNNAEVLAIEWADRGIRVNAVAPGVTRTALVQKGIDEGVIDVVRYRARTPLGRFGEPEEIARAVAFLADDEQSAFVTGATLRVDGGWSAQGWIS